MRWTVEHAAVLCVFREEVFEVVVKLWWWSRAYGRETRRWDALVEVLLR